MRIKSYSVKIFIFEMLISHWSRLWFLLAVNPCDRAVNSFPKWYDTWKSAQKWGYQSQISILVIFLSKPKKIKNPWLGAPGTFFRSPKWYQWTSLKVPEGFLRKKFSGGPNTKLVPTVYCVGSWYCFVCAVCVDGLLLFSLPLLLSTVELTLSALELETKVI